MISVKKDRRVKERSRPAETKWTTRYTKSGNQESWWGEEQLMGT